ncbi:MAG: NINE protein [Bacteroidetes bacterium]|jgi:TM2 domain-containing membrane protein YozV|nr:NINE protein [Bacteroidota bacterium]
MKEKNVAGILALFLGGFGVHRFYLGQTGLGIFYLIFFWFPVMWIVGLIDAIAFFSMDSEDFDRKYNREYFFRQELRREREKNRYRPANRRAEYERRYETRRQRPPSRERRRRPTRKRNNPHKAAGIAKFKDYDYDGAIEEFNKALEVEPTDIATHFNIACAYSINEEADKAFFHLDQAVANGFTDFKRIREHDKLAFVRIQDEYDAFEANGFRLEKPAGEEAKPEEAASATQEEEAVEDHSHILEQLKKLGDLREKGLLTEEEFSHQKKKLLG